MIRPNLRQRSIFSFIISLVGLIFVTVLGIFLQEAATATDFTIKNLPPCREFIFGTDWMGRDMFARTMCGLSMSIRLGLITAFLSACIALALGALAVGKGKIADSIITWIIDLMMGIPHLLLLMLISFALGGGFWGVAIGIILTHWTSLARLIRGEILQLKSSAYLKIAQKMGLSTKQIIIRHMLPHLLPQFTVGLVLLFPHAILHEASITFLGFGLSPEQPAIGIILSESMRYLAMGQWWTALFPGILLLITVIMFNICGKCLTRILDPHTAQS